MQKIFNWTVGSFFRSIGRIIAYIVVGGLIAYLLSSNDFRITDLFFDRLDALTLTQDVVLTESPYINFSNTNDMTCEWDKCYREIDSTTTNTINQYNFSISNTITNVDYVEIPFSVSQPIQVNTSNTTSSTIYANEYCSRWTCGVLNTNTNVCSRYDCAVVTAVSSNNEIIDKEYIEYQTSLTNMNFTVMMTYTNNSFSYCELNNNMIICPLFGDRTAQDLIIQTNFKTARQTSALFNINRSWKLYNKDKSNQDIIDAQNQNTNAINNQTQQQQQQHNEVMDSNTTKAEDEASDFLGNFTVEDTGGLNAIITAPLSTIQSLLNNSCTKLTLPLPFVDKNIELPCLYPIYNEYFGAFFTIYQTIILGIISYRCIKSLFFDVKGFTNPEDDRIEVMDL